MASNNSSVGTELKINVHIEPFGRLHMSDYDFDVKFYVYANRSVTKTKETMIEVDEDNFIACFDSALLGAGKIKARVTAYIPDEDFPDGFRTEIREGDTGVTIDA